MNSQNFERKRTCKSHIETGTSGKWEFDRKPEKILKVLNTKVVGIFKLPYINDEKLKSDKYFGRYGDIVNIVMHVQSEYYNTYKVFVTYKT